MLRTVLANFAGTLENLLRLAMLVLGRWLFVFWPSLTATGFMCLLIILRPDATTTTMPRIVFWIFISLIALLAFWRCIRCNGMSCLPVRSRIRVASWAVCGVLGFPIAWLIARHLLSNDEAPGSGFFLLCGLLDAIVMLTARRIILGQMRTVRLLITITLTTILGLYLLDASIAWLVKQSTSRPSPPRVTLDIAFALQPVVFFHLVCTAWWIADR